MYQNVAPKTIVAKVGNSRNCYTNNHKITSKERAEGKGSHLHLSFYKTDLRADELFAKDNSNFITKGEILFNPFLHREGRKYK